jgi:hypothetical protein
MTTLPQSTSLKHTLDSEEPAFLRVVETNEDKMLVNSVIEALRVLRQNRPALVENIEVVKTKKGYDVIGTLSKSLTDSCVVTFSDFEVLQSVSPARITQIMVQVANGSIDLVVRLASTSTPVLFTTVQLNHIQKKQRYGI